MKIVMMKVSACMLVFAVLFVGTAGQNFAASYPAEAAKLAELEAIVETMTTHGHEHEHTQIGSAIGTDDEVMMTHEDLAMCLDHLWLLVSGALVMFMQAGFAFLEAGSCRSKNAGTLLMKNVLDVCIGTIAWYVLGYGIAYGVGDSPNKFVGTNSFAGGSFLEEDADAGITGTNHFRDWFFQWAFCATAATIVSGGVAERIQLVSYVIYSILMTGIIYPFIVYWTWSGEGFLTNMGYSDFAGSGIVHLTGGIGALAGAIFCGPRAGRWDPEMAEEFSPHNMPMVVLGTFILWFGWYGFNCGSTLGFSDRGTAITAAYVAMNTTISASAGGLTIFCLRLRTRKVDVAGTCNGVLAGLVAVCCGVGSVEPGIAMLIGIVGGLACEGGSVLVKLVKVDDPLDAFAVHGCAGIAGLLLAPLFGMGGVNGEMFGAHIVGTLVIILWSGGLSAIFFGICRVAGVLRASDEEQEMGTDNVHLAQKGYPEGGEPSSPKSPKSLKKLESPTGDV